ncbi:MAG: hypothetical protein MUF01_00540 [Bryobacterales bacterium]|jgi:hypothetical protein|nr:hypothetical protein [Bryobacterales bacterium]
MPEGTRTSLLVLSLLALLVGFAHLAPGQDANPLPSRDDAWVASRDAMQAALLRLGNLTCIQNIRREFNRPGLPGRKSGRGEDFSRLQVSTIEGKEYFAYPGDQTAVTNPSLLLKTGMSGTGVFSGYAQTLFVRQPFSLLKLAGRETWQGRPVLRFEFNFDHLRERLDITRAGRSSSVSVGGEFLVDEADHLLRVLKIRSLDPLPELAVRSVEYDLLWSIVQDAGAAPGSQPLLIPERVDMRLTLFNGEVERNEIQLTQCRQFLVETSLRFDAEEPSEDALHSSQSPHTQQPPAAIRLTGPSVLPEGGELQMALESPVNLAQAAVGDAVLARLTQAVSFPNGPTLAAGTLAELRIRRLERMAKPEPHAVVWIELSALRANDAVYLGLAQLERRDRIRGMADRLETKVQTGISTMWDQTRAIDAVSEELIYPSIPGVGAFLFRGEPGALPAGFKMTWRTLPARSQ